MPRIANGSSPERNRSEPPVPNGSKVGRSGKSEGALDPDSVSTAARVAMGRPALIDDAHLLQLAREMYGKLGRLPKLDELIVGSGGCQRQRAVKALRSIREELAAKVVQDQLVLPHELEGELRRWIDRWLKHAGQQLAQAHVALTERHQQELESAQALVGDQQIAIRELRGSVADLQTLSSELIVRNRELSTECARLNTEKGIAEAIAEDRRRMIEMVGQSVK